MKRITMSVLLACAFAVPLAAAQTLGGMALPGQAADVPLRTKLSLKDLEAFAPVFKAEKVNQSALQATRQKLELLAKAGDPLAQYLLARSYDRFEVGQGTPQDAKIAMQWYTRAADQKYAEVEFFLASVHQYNLLGQPTNLQKAADYLRRSYAHSGGNTRVLVALEMARKHNPEAEGPRLPGFKADAQATQNYLHEVLKLDPTDITALDWLNGIYLQKKDYVKAMQMADRTTNERVWLHMGYTLSRMKPTKEVTPAKAAQYLVRAVTALRQDPDNDGEVQGALYELMALECEKKISRAAYQSVFSQEVFKLYQSFRQGCRVPPGG